MSGEQDAGRFDYLQARRPSRVYRGFSAEGVRVVTVFDSALPEGDDNPRSLSIAASQTVRRASACFGWGTEDAHALQLAIALLLDVSSDRGTALRWCERFAATYVARLPDTWTVPEVDIALWLYCYENAGPGA